MIVFWGGQMVISEKKAFGMHKGANRSGSLNPRCSAHLDGAE